MRVLRALAGSLLWILSGVLGLVGVLLCVTVILLPLGIPLLMVARRLFRYSMVFFLPRKVRHPAQELGKSARGSAKDLGKSARGGAKDAADAAGVQKLTSRKARRKAGKKAGKAVRRTRKKAGKRAREALPR